MWRIFAVLFCFSILLYSSSLAQAAAEEISRKEDKDTLPTPKAIPLMVPLLSKLDLGGTVQLKGFYNNFSSDRELSSAAAWANEEE